MPAKQFKVTKGMRFHSNFADGNPEWEVISPRGEGVWMCEIVDSPDYNGAQNPFTTEQIKSSVQMYEAFNEMRQEHVDYYDQLTVGQILHYHNGFGEYVRCKVAEGFFQNKSGKHLLPIELVGNWKPHDLPKRQKNGNIIYSYYPKKIKEQELFHPNASTIWEYAQSGPDPRNMQAIDITVPDMTPEQSETARLHQVIQWCKNVFDPPMIGSLPYSVLGCELPPRQQLEEVARIIKEELK